MLKFAFLGSLVFPILPLATSTADPILILANYGALGIMLVLILTGTVRTKSEVENRDKQIADKEKTIADQQRIIDAFTANITGQTLPALAKSTHVLEQLPRGEAAIITELQRLALLLEGNKDETNRRGNG